MKKGARLTAAPAVVTLLLLLLETTTTLVSGFAEAQIVFPGQEQPASPPQQQFPQQQFPQQQVPQQQFPQPQIPQQSPPQQSDGNHVSGGVRVQSEPFGANLEEKFGGEEDEGVAAIFFPREEVLPSVPCTTTSGLPGQCRLLVQCAVYYKEMIILSRSPCQISGDQEGVCCPNIPRPKLDTNTIVQKPVAPKVSKPPLDQREINFACEKSQTQIVERNDKEKQLYFNDIVAQKGTPVFLHCRLFDTNENVLDKAEKGTLTLGASLNMAIEFGLSKEQAGLGLSQFNVSNTIIADTCPPEPHCPESKYRTIDGSCNNLRNKDWGQAAIAYSRIVNPDYADGLNEPRKANNGLPLPSPRLLSQRIFEARNNIYEEFTMMIMQWGQFLAHDITHTPISKGDGFTDISCCNGGQVRPPQDLHPDCLPISIPEDDAFYSQFNRRCMEFTRSMPAIRRECRFGPREQMNQITSYIDASNVYGSSQSVATNLREGRGGRLRVTRQENRELLPGDTRALGCGSSDGKRPCFKAGDVRVNEQPDLVVLHTVWLRQHNKVVHELARINPGWGDERLYQEGRRIVVAQMQHITYNEYLPIVLGQDFMVSFGLVPLSDGYATNYLDTVDATINNAFATAAFRYGHTLVAGNIQGYSRFGRVVRDLELSRSQFAPFFLYEKGSLDAMLRGLTIQPSEKFDNNFSSELTNRLFAQNGPFGMDLGALNIQRGRDHGLPSYNAWREICHLPKVKSFGDFLDVMSSESVAKLSNVYQHPDDIDLFVGGLLEKPKAGSLLGHTFLCIVGDQFARLRLGDRFYYENGGSAASFSLPQLNQIRKTSMARIICDNSDDIKSMQPLAFIQSNLANKRVACRRRKVIPRVSLGPWRE